jgi:isopenicillin-N epimerase
MAMVRLPGGEAGQVVGLRAALLEAGTDVPIIAHGSRLWLRLSAQAYNEPADFARMGTLVEAALARAG